MALAHNEAIILDHYDAYNNHDFERGAALIAEDLDWYIVPFEVTLHTPEEYRQFFTGWSVASPEGRIDLERIVAIGEVVVAEYVFRGRQTGVLQTPSEEIPPTNQLMTMPVCELFTIQDGKITGCKTYFDAATLMRQLGILSI